MQEHIRPLLAALADFLPEGEWPRVGRWVCVVVVLAAVLWGWQAGMYAVEHLTFHNLTANSGVRINTSEAKVELLPPSLFFTQISISTSGKSPLAVHLTNVRLSLGLAWPLRPVIHAQSNLYEGTLEAEATLSGWLSPQNMNLAGRWKNLNIRSVQGLLAQHGGTQFVDVQQGTLSGTLNATTTLKAIKNASLDGEGELSVEVDSVNAVSNIPLFKSEKLDAVAGSALLDWKNGTIHIREARISNSFLRLSAQGTARAEQPPSASTVQLRIHIDVEPDQLRLPLLPPRSQEAFASGTPVDVLLNGPVNNLVFGLATTPQTTAKGRP